MTIKTLSSLALLPIIALGAGCSVEDVSGPATTGSGSTAKFACKNFNSKPAAQKAWEKAGSPTSNDRDGDGQVCKSLSKTGGSSSGGTAKTTDCQRIKQVVKVEISRSKSPETVDHFEDAQRNGWPKVLTIDRAGADENRSQSLRGIETQPGKQRDEALPAIAKEGGRAEVGPKKGQTSPVRLITSRDNSRSGSSMGGQLRPYCDGQKFMLVGGH